MLLGEEISGNHQAYRRGHLDITILNEIRAAKECGRNSELVIEAGRQVQILGPW